MDCSTVDTGTGLLTVVTKYASHEQTCAGYLRARMAMWLDQLVSNQPVACPSVHRQRLCTDNYSMGRTGPVPTASEQSCQSSELRLFPERGHRLQIECSNTVNEVLIGTALKSRTASVAGT